MTEQEYFEHFVQRAKERYGIIVDEDLYRTIKITIQKQFRGTTLIDHRRDGELWHITGNKIIPTSMFVIFDKGLPVTCLPASRALNKKLSIVRSRIHRGKNVPTREEFQDTDMYYRHCAHSMKDYFGYTLEKSEWEEWNKKLAKGEVMHIYRSGEDRFGRLLVGSRSLVVKYGHNKILDVKVPSQFWDEKIKNATKFKAKDMARLISEKIRNNHVSFV
mgnify:CR=1 FL=1